MEIGLFKLITSIGLWIVALACGLLPLFARNFRANKMFISLSQCFAGGLFLSIGLIHILPEAHENLEGSWKNLAHEESHFPLSYFICLCTFSLILLIDKVLFNNSDIIEEGELHSEMRSSLMRKSVLGKREAKPEEAFQEIVSHNFKMALSLSRLNVNENESAEDEYLEIPAEKLNPKENVILSQNSHQAPNFSKNESNQPRIKSMNLDVENDQNKDFEVQPIKVIHKDVETHIHNDEEDHFHGKDHKYENKVKKNADHHGHHHATLKKDASYTSAFVILIAMGIHGLFEGLAFGVEKEEADVWNMFIAIAAHKWCDSLIVGISFVSAELPIKMAVALTILLSLFTPAGILIGSLSMSNQTVTGVFQALSAGTFIYISCAEIIIEEFAIAEKKFLKFMMYSLGIIFITLMSQLEHKD